MSQWVGVYYLSIMEIATGVNRITSCAKADSRLAAPIDNVSRLDWRKLQNKQYLQPSRSIGVKTRSHVYGQLMYHLKSTLLTSIRWCVGAIFAEIGPTVCQLRLHRAC